MTAKKRFLLGRISLIAVFLTLLSVYSLQAGKDDHDQIDSTEENYEGPASEEKVQMHGNGQRVASSNAIQIQSPELDMVYEEKPVADVNPRSRTQPDEVLVFQNRAPITILPADSVAFLDSHVLDLAPDASFAKYPSIDQQPDVAEQIVGAYEGTIQWTHNRSIGKAILEIEGAINQDRRFEGSYTFRIMDNDGRVMAEPNSKGLIGDRIRIEARPVLTVFIEPDSKSNNKKIQLFFPDGAASQLVQGNYYFNFKREGAPLSHAAYINLVKKPSEHEATK